MERGKPDGVNGEGGKGVREKGEAGKANNEIRGEGEGRNQEGKREGEGRGEGVEAVGGREIGVKENGKGEGGGEEGGKAAASTTPNSQPASDGKATGAQEPDRLPAHPLPPAAVREDERAGRDEGGSEAEGTLGREFRVGAQADLQQRVDSSDGHTDGRGDGQGGKPVPSGYVGEGKGIVGKRKAERLEKSEGGNGEAEGKEDEAKKEVREGGEVRKDERERKGDKEEKGGRDKKKPRRVLGPMKPKFLGDVAAEQGVEEDVWLPPEGKESVRLCCGSSWLINLNLQA